MGGPRSCKRKFNCMETLYCYGDVYSYKCNVYMYQANKEGEIMTDEQLNAILSKADDDLEALKDKCHDLYEENQRLKARLTDTEWQYDNMRIKVAKQYIEGVTEELLEDIETCFFNGEEKPDLIPIDSLDICHIFGYIDQLKKDYNKAMDLVDKGVENSYKTVKDYKSRCEKAIEYIQDIKNITKHGIYPNYTYEVDTRELLNILQGEDKQ